MSSNGKDNVEVLSQIFNTYFSEKCFHQRIAIALRRNNMSKIAQIELHDVKFVCTAHARN